MARMSSSTNCSTYDLEEYTPKESYNAILNRYCLQWFQKVEFNAKTNPDGTVDINIPFKETIYPSKPYVKYLSVGMCPGEKPIDMVDSNMTPDEIQEYFTRISMREQHNNFWTSTECIFPEQMRKEIEWMVKEQTSLSASLLVWINRHIRKWYHDNGYRGARVVKQSFDTFHLIFEVAEGDITHLSINFQDKKGNSCHGITNIELIKRVLPKTVAVGQAYNVKSFEKAKENINSLGLFSNVNIIPEQKRNGTFSAEIVLQERPQNWAQVIPISNAILKRGSRPTLSSLEPGAMVLFGHRNIEGLNRSFQGALKVDNLINPEDDCGFNFEYTSPYVHLDRLNNPWNHTFKATCFSTRKLSPAVMSRDDIPTWVDRAGIKATITEDLTKHSKFTCGLALEDTKTNGKEGAHDGMTWSGMDRKASLLANLTRDNTRSVNGAIVGARYVFQVNRELRSSCTKIPLCNQLKISATRFIPLKNVVDGEGNAPSPLLVLHGLYGICFGNIPNHNAFTVGGPYSVRGYNVGEIGVSRSKLEVAAEVRVPVKNAYAYAFVEHGSSIGLAGNPQKGNGSSYGAGIKLSQLRAEYVVNNNTKKGAFYLHVGERFGD